MTTTKMMKKKKKMDKCEQKIMKNQSEIVVFDVLCDNI